MTSSIKCMYVYRKSTAKNGECNTKCERKVDTIYLAFSKTNDLSSHYLDLKKKKKSFKK